MKKQRRGNLLPMATKCRAAVASVVGLSGGKLYNQGRALYVIRGSGMESNSSELYGIKPKDDIRLSAIPYTASRDAIPSLLA